MSNDHSRSHTFPGRERAAIGLLVIGFLAIAFGTAVARSAPSQGYELSIYAATPIGFWIAIGVAFTVALTVALRAPTARVQTAALTLGWLAAASVVFLPAVRGYAYHGAGDSMTHLGWVRDIADSMSAFELLYPGLHVGALFIEGTTGTGVERSTLFVVFAFSLTFVTFVPLTVGAIADDQRAIAIGLFSAALFLPINNISATMTAHPSTLAVLFLPFVLYLVVTYLRTNRTPGPVGGLLATTSLAMVLVHPQQAANLLAFFCGIVGVQATRRRLRDDAVLRPLYGQTVFLGAAFALWSREHERASGSVELLVTTLITGPEGGSAVDQRGTSLADIGGSIEEIFLKLFLVSAIYVGLAGVAVGWGLLSRRSGSKPERRVVQCLAIGLVPVGILFTLYLVASIDTMYFRHLGFLMAGATILGALGLHVAVGALSLRSNWLSGRFPTLDTLAGPFVAVVLVLSLLALYPSPYIYQPNMHITESSMAGHETAFEHADDEFAIVGIRTGPVRYEHALYGPGDTLHLPPDEETSVPLDAFETGLVRYYDDPTYVTVTTADRDREYRIYRELRYTEAAVDGAGNQPGVHRTQHNGEFELYFVDVDGDWSWGGGGAGAHQ